MAISRGHRKVSKAKADSELKKKVSSLIIPVSNKRKKRKRKRKEIEPAGSRHSRFRHKYIRNKVVKKAKREAKKEKKLAKKARSQLQKSKPKAQEPLDSEETKEAEPVPETEPDKESEPEQEPEESTGKWDKEPDENWGKSQYPLLDDVIYSTFDSLLRDVGEYDSILKNVVQYSIDTFGKENAMQKLEDYMHATKDKLNIFNVPLQYKEAVMRSISGFCRAMYGRPLSLAELDNIESQLDSLWGVTSYKGSHSTTAYLNKISNE